MSLLLGCTPTGGSTTSSDNLARPRSGWRVSSSSLSSLDTQRILEAWARVRQGQGEQAIADIRSGIDAYRATGAELESSYWFALLADACATVGAVKEGLAALTEGVNLLVTTGVPFCHAELLRLKGELL